MKQVARFIHICKSHPSQVTSFSVSLTSAELRQETFRNLGVPAGSGVPEASQKAVAAFLRDFPEPLSCRGRCLVLRVGDCLFYTFHIFQSVYQSTG